MCPNIFHLDLVTLSESGVTSQRAYRSLLVCNNMRISHINNTSKMFTMADIDFVEYILWCCPAVPVAYTLLYFSKAALPSMQQCFMSTVLQSRDPRDTLYSFPPGFSIFRELEVHPFHRVHLYPQ